MKVKLQNPGPNLCEADLREFEGEIGARLPDDYREFLLECNGGTSADSLMYADREVRTFIKLVSERARGLKRAHRALSRLSTGYLPIAIDTGDDEFCIALDGTGVFIAVYGYDDQDLRSRVTFEPVAESFSIFLQGLTEVVDYDQIATLGANGSPADLADYLRNGGTINDLSSNQLTILCEAIKAGNTSLVEELIELGADLSSSIKTAMYGNRVQLLEMLVRAGADVNELDEFGDTPLHYAVGPNGRVFRELLIRHGAVEK